MRKFMRRAKDVMYAIRSKATGRYLASFNTWTEQVLDATCFPNGLSIVLHLEQHQLGEIEEDIEIIPVPILTSK
jgi:hypothetical protein